ncbi:MAG: ATP-dependent Clp protease ATP-binding subunit [Candidatus Sericytochromatia bacterium]|nr:ATP-dependent Clp protease ATP-binding subunit [Candidatus Sericytochromatia bacterium]
MLEHFSQEALKAVMYAQEEARRAQAALVEVDHLFVGLLRDPGTAAYEVLQARQVDPGLLRRQIQLEMGARRSPMDLAYSETVQDVFRLAEAEAHGFGFEKVESDHLLLALIEMAEGQALKVLSEAGLNLNHLRWHTLRLRYTKRNAAIRMANLDRYSLDLTAELEQGHLATVVEWEPMVERLIQYLGMQQKHNVLLVGEQGVGKTALIHALNQYILDSRIYRRFAHCRVVFLYVDKMLAEAGTSDERLYEVTQSIMAEIRQSGDIILVIENIHQLFLAQKKELEFVITQQLLTLLEEKDTFCIATTTPHFLTLLEERTNVRHLFQLLQVPEPPAAFCTHILTQWRPRLEAHHGLEMVPAALELAVRLAQDKLPGHLPDSALSLLDLAAARKQWQLGKDRQSLRMAERQLRHLVEQRALMAEEMAHSAAAQKAFEQIKADILRTETQLQRLQQRLQNDAPRLEAEDVMAAAEHPGGLG